MDDKKESLGNVGYNPTGEEKEIQEMMAARVSELKEARKRKLVGIDRSIEDIWREVDREFSPHELGVIGSDRTRIATDDELGYRGRVTKLGEGDTWQSDKADPIFYTKVQTALATLVDQNPEAVFYPSSSKYEANTKIAYSNWKQSWEVSGAKQQLKNFIMNLAKYGIGVGKTYPKKITMKKKVLIEYTGKKKKYAEKELVKYNDLCRKSFNPWQVWVSEMARPGDRFSIDDWYYEEDFSWDKFKQEFPEADYPNVKLVKKGAISRETSGEDVADYGHKDMVTVGFYENQVTDKFVIWIPSQNIVLDHSPLPNDDGLLSLWLAPWTLRDDRSVYGIGIYEIIKNDVVMYDRFKNMTMDQLTLSIYKMFFYKGLNALGTNGKLVISPGAGEQVLDPKDINFLNVPGPGADAWHGMEFLQDRINTNSGVPEQLSGQFSGKTLGQDVEAKNAALQRMKTPLDYILDALQEEAYISLSWLKQILSTPEVMEFNDSEDLLNVLKEAGLGEQEIQEYLAVAQEPGSELLFQEEQEDEEPDEFGAKPIKKFANVYKEVSMGFEKDENGELIESEENRFYRFGVHLPLKTLDWRGMIRIKPQSVMAPSKDLVKRMKLDLFNLVYPAIQGMLAMPQNISILLPPIKQVLKAFEENVKDWFDEKALMGMAQAASQPQEAAQPEAKISLSVKFEDYANPNLTEAQKQISEKYLGIKIEEPLFVKSGAIGGQQASAMANSMIGGQGEQLPPDMAGGAAQIEPLADLGSSPETLSGAVGGANQV